MISPFSILFLAGLAAAQVRNSGNGVQFLFPNEDGLSVNFLDTVNITYTSPFANPLLYTFCYNVSNHKQSIQTSRINANPYNSSHLYKLTYPNVSGCYWNLRPNTSTGYGANSFDILILPEGAQSLTTIGVNLPAATNTVSSTSSGTGTGTASPNPTDAGNTGAENMASGNGNTGGMSTGVKAGIGAGVGVVALVAIAGLVFWLLRKRRNGKEVVHEKSIDGDSTAVVGDPYGYQHVKPEETGYVGAVGGAEAGKVTELQGAGHSYYAGDGKPVEAGSGEKKVPELGAGGYVPQQPQTDVYEMGDGGRR